jgi:single-stranded-DNA-specific exonuclease
LVETFYKPAIVLVETEGVLSGSARSIPGVDLFDALSSCSDVLLKYGGHAMAAGLSLECEKLTAFEEQFERVVSEMLAYQRPTPVLEYEAEVSFSEMTAKFYRILRQFAPFGPENMRPVFLAKNVRDAGYTRKVGQNADHLKLHVVQDESGVVFDGIGFNLGGWESSFKEGGLHDILFCLDENEWQGTVRMQLIIKDVRKATQG